MTSTGKGRTKTRLRNILRPRGSAHVHDSEGAFPEGSNYWQDRPPLAAGDSQRTCRDLGTDATHPVKNPRTDASVHSMKKAGSSFCASQSELRNEDGMLNKAPFDQLRILQRKPQSGHTLLFRLKQALTFTSVSFLSKDHVA